MEGETTIGWGGSVTCGAMISEFDDDGNVFLKSLASLRLICGHSLHLNELQRLSLLSEWPNAFSMTGSFARI